MLHTETVAPATLELLRRLQAEDITKEMRLVRGASLALQIAHRKSTDLDLFSYEQFDVEAALDLLVRHYAFTPSRVTRNSIIGFIGQVKVDMIYHPYSWLTAPLCEDGFRLAGLEDITAMKLHAIANSGERPKDFVDIAFLSQFFSYNQMKVRTLEKYPAYDAIMIDKSINYFQDVDTDSIEDIHMIGYRMEWDSIEERLFSMTDNPDKVFPRVPLKKNKKINQRNDQRYRPRLYWTTDGTHVGLPWGGGQRHGL